MSKFHPQTTLADIVGFFQEMGIFLKKEYIRLLRDDYGHSIGECIIKCPNTKLSTRAVEHSGTYFGKQRVKIVFSNFEYYKFALENEGATNFFPTNKVSRPEVNYDYEEYDENPYDSYEGSTFDESLSSIDNQETYEKVVMIKEAPYKTVNKPDVYQMFSNARLKQVYIEFDGNGKVNGNIYVEFEDYADYQNALAKNNYMLKNKPVKLVEISSEEFISRIETHQKVMKSLKVPKYASVPYDQPCRSPTHPDDFIEPDNYTVYRVKVIDVSKEASIRDLIKFAMSHNPIENSSSIVKKKSSNDIYLGFSTKNDAIRFIYDYKGKRLFFGKTIDCNLIFDKEDIRK